MSIQAHARARAAADRLRSRTGVDAYTAAVVLGSGWGPAADALGTSGVEVDVTELPGFAEPTAQGHRGVVRSVSGHSGEMLVFLGRSHLYEGHEVDTVVHNVRTAVAAGASTIVLTNASGALDPALEPGRPVLISDHVNLTARSPIVGAKFVDLTDAYSPALRALAREVDPSLPEAVYAAVPGPQFETPAEVRMLRALGADLVGMSTVLETIAAREVGADVLGVSLVTNPAAGLNPGPIDHRQVLATGRAVAADVGVLLADVLKKL
ncbi:purine-nucleoside phosphorylase [Thermobifida halotolerans]|uniref:Purine nucleoside phosphorylase n=1 Tax=Thermobifida halotolerans TaxID=483545 RepID=A0A399G7G3_9ACTN|nr:purine-nucleoside phosphorylase [Thermobifida halotolerans]UOE17965.1 purine-nucleoside phosphorylase [Thermobifida halotolerans]